MFALGLTIGAFVGATLAALIISACLLARRADDQGDHWPEIKA